MADFPFGTVIHRMDFNISITLMVIGPNLGVCLIDIPWRYAGEITEFAGDDWEVLDGPYE